MEDKQLLSAILFRLDDIHDSLDQLKTDNANTKLLIEKSILEQEKINDNMRGELLSLKREVIALQKAC